MHAHWKGTLALVAVSALAASAVPATAAAAAPGGSTQQAIYRDYAALNKEPHVKPGLPLGLPQDAVTVQVRDGKTVTKNGTYLDEIKKRLPPDAICST